MRQGGIGAVGGYGLETFSPEAGDLGAEFMEFERALIFIERLSGLNHLLKPVEESFHGKSVLKMGFLHARDFHLVLDGFSQGYRRFAGHHIFLQGVLLENSVKVVVQG